VYVHTSVVKPREFLGERIANLRLWHTKNLNRAIAHEMT